ncbi:unnamed protein product [Prorocentrum cordatum]|uniref:Mei2-like C-terminal RNA recognition motif domain-containing protein n=1 Tax=Prorocentrum cordatum TaxID=2364126 RepID=A0ABN9TBS0_9DINO|nr:unnamed protein product [Polarella glacialis]
MPQLASWMPSTRNANLANYVYTAAVFAAVCVGADLLISCLSQLSDAQVQNTLFAVVLSVGAFVAGSVNAGHKKAHAKAAPAKKLAAPAKKPVQAKGITREGEHKARQAAKRLAEARGAGPVAAPSQSNPAAEPKPAQPPPAEPQPAAPPPAAPQPAAPQPAAPQPAETQPAGPQAAEPQPAAPQPAEPQPAGQQAAEPHAAAPSPAEPAAERGASYAAQAAESQPELPQMPLKKAPRYAGRSSTDPQVPTKSEDTTSKAARDDRTRQSGVDTCVVEQPRQQGVASMVLDMPECVRSNDAVMALKLFDHLLQADLDYDCMATAIPEATRISFFTLVAEQFGDERLRRDGLHILAAVQAHGVQPPHILQNRLICAWGGTLPQQVLDYFVKMREEGIALSSAACRCIMADVVGSTGGKACSPPVDAATSQDDSVRDGAEEDPDVARHAATERTSLRREASTFVPKCLEGPWQVQPEESTVCSWVPRPPPGLCDEFPQVDTQQMGYQYDDGTTIILRNLPCPFLRDNLIALMDAKGFAGFYDFVYLPVDFKTGMGLGYAFVNILTEEVRRFALAFDGFKDWPRYASGADLSRPRVSAKICAVDMSRTQGLFANVERYRNSPLMSDEVPDRFRPVLFNGTERVPFPEPTRELPRVLHKSIEW